MRVVLDTNILFSALISPHGAPDRIYRAWRTARFEIVTSLVQPSFRTCLKHYQSLDSDRLL